MSDLKPILWSKQRQDDLLRYPYMNEPGIGALTAENLPMLLQETLSSFELLPDQEVPKIKGREEQMLIGMGQKPCPISGAQDKAGEMRRDLGAL